MSSSTLPLRVREMHFLRGKYELRPAVKKLYQLRPKVSASGVSVASRIVNPKHDELRPAVSKELYQLRPKVFASCVLVVSRVVTARIWVASKDLGIQHVQQYEGSYTVLLYVSLYTTICTCTELLNDTDNAQLLYHVTF
jgi:hypothetical protein